MLIFLIKNVEKFCVKVSLLFLGPSLYHLWESWSEWSVCSTNCFGLRSRRRSYSCIPKNKCGTDPSVDIEPCNTVRSLKKAISR